MVHLLRACLAGVVLTVVAAASAATAQTAQGTVTLADGRKLAMTCVGEGGPTILLDAGLGMPLASWNKVMPELGKTARTCAYNRAGYMGSDPGPMPRDAAHVVDDMKALTAAAGLPAPYVLVAQSLGGNHARLFAARFPDQVAGVVLIDPVTDDEARLRAAAPEEEQSWRGLEDRVERCIRMRARGEAWSGADPANAICGPAPTLPLPAADIAMAQAVVSEYSSRGISTRQIGEVRTGAPRFPIIVLTADGATRYPDAPQADVSTVQAVYVELHRQIAATSPTGEQRTIAGGSHLMQWDKPEVVIATIREVVTRYRNGG